MAYQPLFTYFGGKSSVSDIVWERFGDVGRYIEPFAGSAAILMKRPSSHSNNSSVLNDASHFVSNFWRSVKNAPDEVAKWADYPVIEVDLHAKHYWLVSDGKKILAANINNPEWYDAKIAGYWLWGMCAFLGGGFASGNSGWIVDDNNQWQQKTDRSKPGILRSKPYLSRYGRGINRFNTGGMSRTEFIHYAITEVSQKLRETIVCSGDFERVLTNSCLDFAHTNTVGIFIDPPYDGYSNGFYSVDNAPAKRAYDWAVKHGNDQRIRIAYCGYDDMPIPDGWEVFKWKTTGGMGNQGKASQANENKHREIILFSPHCIRSSNGVSTSNWWEEG